MMRENTVVIFSFNQPSATKFWHRMMPVATIATKKRSIPGQLADQRPGKAAIDDNHRHDRRWSCQKRNRQRVDGKTVSVGLICVKAQVGGG